MSKAIVISIVAALGTMPIGSGYATAATTPAYDAKKADCKRQAKEKHFGIHLIKRNRWIKECIARS